MKAETRAQNAVARAQWYGIALFFPQTHPQELDDIAAYEQRYGAKPDGPESAPWMYSEHPTQMTPMNWKAPVTPHKYEFYDPRDGQVYLQGSKPDNNLDPTSPTFEEPPELPA